jgi:hypothetical protein
VPSPDTAKAIKDALAAEWDTAHPTWTAVLHVDDDYQPTANEPVLLVADDGGPAVIRGAWLVRKTPRRPLIRLTGFAVGRTEALTVVDAAVDYVLANKPGLARIEDVSTPLVTRDRATGAFLASITMPVIVRTITA